MFTGLIERKGRVVGHAAKGPSARLSITSPDLAGEPLALGESIAVDGVCLTVDAVLPGPRGFEADCSAETLAKTTLGALAVGDDVHLERAMPLGGRMGGHLVTGHVDGVGTIVSRRPVGDAEFVAFSVPAELAPYIAPKGSIAVSGISLTVNQIEHDRFDVVLVPHTLGKTKLGAMEVGARVNLEVDLVARYVARLLGVDRARAADAASSDAAWIIRLQRHGYL